MPAVQDSRDNVGGEKGEPDETRNVRPDDPLLYGDLSQGSAEVLKQARAYGVSPDEKAYQDGIDIRRLGSIIDHHSHLYSRSLQPRADGQDC
jgi:hypothetical protein